MKQFIIALIIVVVIIGGYYFINNSNKVPLCENLAAKDWIADSGMRMETMMADISQAGNLYEEQLILETPDGLENLQQYILDFFSYADRAWQETDPNTANEFADRAERALTFAIAERDRINEECDF
ncbi:MAG: hypothetical protein FVQ83_13365 [Chloroflexi bacterium]|nr:hypothetical protein [Chloroflexota bacterium]